MGKRLKSKWVICPQCGRRVKQYSNGSYSVHYSLAETSCRPTPRAADGLKSGQKFNPYDLNEVAEVDNLVNRRR